MRRLGHGTMRVALLAVLGAAGLMLAPAPAAAAPDPAIVDCTVHNHLTKHYSVQELRHALATLPADVTEYSICSDVLQRALDQELGGLNASGGNGSGGGSFLPLPVILVLVLLLLGGAGYGAVVLRRRAEAEEAAEAEPDGAADPPSEGHDSRPPE